MKLLEAQQLFTQLVARLIQEAHAMGYAVTLGEAWRPPEVVRIYLADGRGSANSLHPLRLGVDLNLFRNGRYLTATEDHQPLGEWWERQHPRCRWGGRFRPRPDGNHYSFTPDGKRA